MITKTKLGEFAIYPMCLIRFGINHSSKECDEVWTRYIEFYKSANCDFLETGDKAEKLGERAISEWKASHEKGA